MFTTRASTALSCLVIAAIASVALAQTPPAPKQLRVGDEMPAIGDDAKWIKGEPVESFEPGNVYVLDFWATWCRPCIAAIPHMAKTARQYEDQNVHVIGVALDSRRATPTAKFVEQQGDKMPYRVCEDIQQRLAKRIMMPAGIRSIPTIMIVDHEGKIAWMGHPSSMDRPLADVVAKAAAADPSAGAEPDATATRSGDSG